MNLIEGAFGMLGVGKTLRITMKSYNDFLDGKEIFSNIPVTFKHTPLKTVEDFLNLEHGTILGDELWAISDNRKRSLLTDLAVIFCLRSRKKDLTIRYTQQFLQIDVRIAYITNLWVKPCCYPFSKDPEINRDIIPEYMICERWNSNLEKLPSELFNNIKDYFSLYDTTKDPYFIKEMIDTKLVKRIKKKLKEELSDKELKEYNKILARKGMKKLDELS